MKQQNSADVVDVNPSDYPALKAACESYRDFATGTSGEEMTGEQNELHWRRIFDAAKEDGLLPKTAKFTDYHERLKKDLSEVIIERDDAGGVDADLAALMQQLGIQ